MNVNPMQMLMQALANGQNPNQLIEQMAQMNPKSNALLQQYRQSGMSPKNFCMQFVKQNNINANPMLNIFAQRGIKL